MCLIDLHNLFFCQIYFYVPLILRMGCMVELEINRYLYLYLTNAQNIIGIIVSHDNLHFVVVTAQQTCSNLYKCILIVQETKIKKFYRIWIEDYRNINL